MYLDTPIVGTTLPPGTLCLTYDDGPDETPGVGVGPHSRQLAEFLSSQSIPATFFMVGKHALGSPTLPAAIASLGHLVANHTFHHPNLPQFLAMGGDPVREVLTTDPLIQPHLAGGPVFFRPPYGSWSPAVAAALNANWEASLNHVGPILWDIDAGDWSSWQTGESPATAASRYFTQIVAAGAGIVLLHDSTADMGQTRRENQTCLMTQLLIPQLVAAGFQFVRLDHVRGAALAAHIQGSVALRAFNGRYVSPQGGGGGRILLDGPAVGPWEVLDIAQPAPGKVALRTPSRLWLSPQNGGGGTVLANGPAIAEWELLDLLALDGQRVAFRTANGSFLTMEAAAGGELMATAPALGPWEVFTWEPA